MTNSFAPSLRDIPSWQSCGARCVAVYGTLRAGGVNHIQRFRTDCLLIGRTALKGTLYDMGWYPGLRLQGEQHVLAEVYSLDSTLEQALDGYEGIWPQDTGEYTKRIVTVLVALTGGGVQTMAVLVYEALPAAVSCCPVIEAEDWLIWCQTHQAHLQNQNKK